MDVWSVEIEHAAELLKHKLYFAVTFSEKVAHIKNTLDAFYFNVDGEFQYANYYMDFGPLNISCLYKYCMKLHSFMQCTQLKRIVHYTTSDPQKRINGAFLVGSYCVIYHNMDPKLVYKKLLDTGGPFKSYVDASQGLSRYTLKLSECLQGIQKAYVLNFFDFDDFCVAEYDLYDKIQNGDFNWLVPRKFLALIGPIDKEISPLGHSPSFYIKYFLKNDVKTVIRLNNKLYDAFVFANAGIKHYDLFFPDGTTPPKHILIKFLNIAETTNGAIAVHCKAGLGRTGSLIGAYIMKHFQFTAKEAIAWMRICRPGSVIAQQQGWLERIEAWLWKEGRIFRQQMVGDADKLPHHKYGIYSRAWQDQRRAFLHTMHKRHFASSCSRTQLSFIEHDVQLQNRDNNNVRAKRMLSSSCNEDNENKTQGDRLNDIKMRKFINSLNGGKQCNPRFGRISQLRNVHRFLPDHSSFTPRNEMRTNGKLIYYM